MIKNNEDNARHFSLKWKAIISLSLVLALTYTLFYAFFNSELLYTKHSVLHQKNSLIDHSLGNFINFADRQLITFTEILAQHIQINPKKPVRNVHLLQQFNESVIPRLRETGMIYSAILKRNGQIQLDWQSQSDRFANSIDWANELGSQQIKRKNSWIFCHSICVHVALSPIRDKGEVLYHLLVAQNLNHVLQQFIGNSPYHIALILPSNFGDSLNYPKEEYLAAWNSRLILAPNNDPDIEQMLQRFHIRHDLGSLGKEISYYQNSHGNHELTRFTLPSRLISPNIVALKIEHEREFGDQSMFIRKFIGTSLGSVMLSGTILLLVLWRPLSRLNKIVNAMPLIAQSRFSQYQTLLEKQSPMLFSDEVDHLGQTAFKLTRQLEDLHKQVNTRSEQLAENVELLQREMEFIQQVLDTAQVIILTLNAKNEILLINDYGLSLMGYDKKSVVGRPLSDFVQYSSLEDQQDQQLDEVTNGQRKRLKLNSRLICHNGRHREITWLHSHLTTPSRSGKARLLSVGLDVTESKIAEQQITWMAEHDSLTGLNNRRSFQHEVDNILRLSARYSHQSAIMFLDLDNFKNINDTQGHQAGDLVIKHIAHTLKRILRDSDILARIGGDEFAIALPQIGSEGAQTVATSINKAMAELSFPGSSPMNRLSASIGISIYPEHGSNCKALLANADLAMYRAKQRGRACSHIYSPDESGRTQLQQEVLWRQRIENALEFGKFILHFQPIMNLFTNEITHYEALIRMRSDDGSILAPAPFITVAERCGLIGEIDHWVLREVTKKISQLDQYGSPVHISVNLSAHAFSDHRLINLMTELSMKNFLCASNVILEITETEALQDFSSACQLIKNLKKLGYKFALDDFGVGFSSFYYLQQLPVDYIKIDGSFVQNLPNNTQNHTLVKAITDVAKGFGKRCIAEYVEDEETLDLLKAYGVDYAQGYHIGVPAADIGAYEKTREVLQAE